MEDHSAERNHAPIAKHALFASSLFEQSSDCIIYASLGSADEFRVQDINPSAADLFEIQWDGPRANASMASVFGRSAELIDSRRGQLIASRQKSQFHARAKTVLGERTLEITYLPVPNQSDELIGAVITARDVTYLEICERSLKEKQKLEALGMLSAGISHDMNNVLQALSACLHSISKKTGDSHCDDLFKEAEKTIDRGLAIANRFLSFIQRRDTCVQPIEIKPVLSGVASALRRSITDDIAISVAAPPDLWIMANQSELETTLINLVLNSRDAMPDGGTITLRAKRFERMASQGRDDPGVQISVEDTGVGIPAALREKVLQPFFTTKEIGAGTGLGLSMAAQLAKELGGELALQSKEDVGTVVTLTFPGSAPLG